MTQRVECAERLCGLAGLCRSLALFLARGTVQALFVVVVTVAKSLLVDQHTLKRTQYGKQHREYLLLRPLAAAAALRLQFSRCCPPR